MMTGRLVAGRFSTGGPESRTYHRDKDGKFASGGGGGARGALAQATSIEELNGAAAAEMKRISGRDVRVDMQGAKLDEAKEHLEGVCRGLERYPGVELSRVDTYGTGSRDPSAHTAYADAFAITSHGDSISFNNDNESGFAYRDRLAGLERAGFLAVGTPIGVGLHEFGHAVGDKSLADGPAAVIASRAAKAAGTYSGAHVTAEISRYATSSDGELLAEALADVMAHGSKASALSQSITETNDELYTQYVGPVGGGASNRFPIHGLPLNLAATDVDLSAVQAAWERQLATLLKQWFTVTEHQRDQILDKVRAAINNNDLAALAALNVSSSEQAHILTEAMTEMALAAAQHVVDEAARQGVRIDPVATDTHKFALTATALAALLTAGLANAAGREALRRWSPSATGDDVARAVRTHLESLSTASVEANLGGALTSAQNAGRLETMLAGPTAALYGSEVMDGTTCKPCRQINGKWIGNTDDPDITAKVEAIYPNGGYVNCEGGVRCRGTVVSVYRPATVDTVAA